MSDENCKIATLEGEVAQLRRMIDASLRKEGVTKELLGRLVGIVEVLEIRTAALEGDAS
ncbi:hypothetical protein [Aureimonas glaciei]|uniref:Uncharacterized protein n=1 Tax=Aureimonas glaciei TaxID=1776957 RepID=A0A916Y325_9HYPH|nr:hypothetical protein [Aureimonas glaciei]GGD28607.1 hypothetical protein GCM10011335_34750 [Aureimonas glaciei]